MKLGRQTIYVNLFGACSDGTSMYDWSVKRLKECIYTCWDKTISDLAKQILLDQRKELLTEIPDAEKLLNPKKP